MVTADQSGRNYLFPSSRTALDFYKERQGEPVSDEIIFNTPLVLYSHKAVAEALMTDGTVTLSDGVYYADMQKLTLLMNHINSISGDIPDGKCLYDAAKEFIAKKLPFVFGLRNIPADQVVAFTFAFDPSEKILLLKKIKQYDILKKTTFERNDNS